MSKRVPASEPGVKRIKVVGPAVPRLDPAAVANALGAAPDADRIESHPGPLSLYTLRAEMMRRRQSSGGRPGIEGANLRAKIPLSEDDWSRLNSLAASLSAEGFAPSAGQVASVLLKVALRSIAEEENVGSTEGGAKILTAEVGR